VSHEQPFSSGDRNEPAPSKKPKWLRRQRMMGSLDLAEKE